MGVGRRAARTRRHPRATEATPLMVMMARMMHWRHFSWMKSTMKTTMTATIQALTMTIRYARVGDVYNRRSYNRYLRMDTPEISACHHVKAQ